jgi:hypothetical protein
MVVLPVVPASTVLAGWPGGAYLIAVGTLLRATFSIVSEPAVAGDELELRPTTNPVLVLVIVLSRTVIPPVVSAEGPPFEILNPFVQLMILIPW